MVQQDPFVIFISFEHPQGAGGGGIATYTSTISQAMIREGCPARVLAAAVPWRVQGSAPGGCVTFLSLGPWLYLAGRCLYNVRRRFPQLWKQYWGWVNLAWSFRVWREVRRITRATSPMVLECPDCNAEGFFIALCKSKHWRLVVRLHLLSSFVDQHNDTQATWVQKLLYRMERFTIERADLIVAPSISIAEVCGRKLGLNREKIVVVPNPIDSSLFSPSQAGKKADRPTILYVGRLEKQKGVVELLEAFKQVRRRFPQVELVLIGRDTDTAPGERSMKNHLLSLLDEQEESCVNFLENKNRAELVPYYHAASVCVVPSYYEAFSYTCLEAMACGNAVVGSKAGGMAEIIEDGVSGLLVDMTRSWELPKAICRLLENSDLRKKLGENAARRALEHYQDNKIAQKVISLYKGLR